MNDRRYTTDLYFEAHVTIDPVAGVELIKFESICRAFGFRVAKLLMQKGAALLPSDLDAFCTRRDDSYPLILERTQSLIARLKQNGFGVRRFKIENTLLDVRTNRS